ncbi:MAG: hypothetical protein C4589_11125 [Peptococcaceae bacterium]|nr:MAG: hypothetical protein C4589_11125 [Peptococcaceae bacterium]
MKKNGYENYEDCIDHFTLGISQEIKDFATNAVFRHSRYIFTRREGKRQYGYCTHCRKEFQTRGYLLDQHSAPMSL